MQLDEHRQSAKHAVEWLIVNASRYNLPVLRRLYHQDLEVVQIDDRGGVTTLNRDEVLAKFTNLRDSGAPYPDTSTEFNLLEADDEHAQAIVTRRLRVDGRAEKRIVSLDLVREAGRWRIRRETVLVQPDDGVEARDYDCGLTPAAARRVGGKGIRA